MYMGTLLFEVSQWIQNSVTERSNPCPFRWRMWITHVFEEVTRAQHDDSGVLRDKCCAKCHIRISAFAAEPYFHHALSSFAWTTSKCQIDHGSALKRYDDFHTGEHKWTFWSWKYETYFTDHTASASRNLQASVVPIKPSLCADLSDKFSVIIQRQITT